MYKRLLEQQTAVSAVLLESKSKNARDLLLTPDELTRMEQLVAVLEPLGEATEYLATVRFPSLSVVEPLVTAICKKTLQITDDDSNVVCEFMSAVLNSLKQHFGDNEQQQLSRLASVVDPRYKHLKFLPSAEREQAYSHLSDTLSTMIEEQPQPAVDTEPPDPKRSKVDPLLDYQDSSDSNGSSPAQICAAAIVEKEILQYKADDPISRTSDPLKWWKENETRFTYLSKVAKKLLCIQATSVPSERLFSAAGNIVSKKRASLHSTNVDCLLFLHKNMFVQKSRQFTLVSESLLCL